MTRLRPIPIRWLNKVESQWWLYFASLSLALVLLAFLVRSAIYLAGWPEDGVGWSSSTNRVSQVDPAGPAANILQRGDLIINWDGIPIDQTTQLYAGKQPGDEVQLTVSRDGQILTVILRLAAPSAATIGRRLEPLLIALTFWALGIVVFAFNTANNTARLFYYIFSHVGCSVLIFGALSTTGLVWASWLFYLSMWLLGPLVVHLHLYFPSLITIPHRQFLIIILYACAAAAALACLVFAAASMRVSQGLRFATLTFLSVNFLVAVTLLVQSYRTLPSARRQIRLVVLGTVLALIPFCGLTLLPSALFGQPILSNDIAFLFLLIIPLAYGYSIIRYRLIRLARYISRRFANLVLVVILAIIHLLFDMGSHYLFASRPELTLAAIALFSAFIVITFVPMRDKLQKMIDWAFYGGWYSYGTAVQKISQTLDQVMDASALAVVLPQSLAAIMKLECSCLIFLDQSENRYSHMTSCPHCPIHQAGEVRISSSSAMSQCLRQERQPILGDLLRQRLSDMPLTPDEQRLLMCTQERVWIPLLGRDTLLGILILGPKQCEDTFGPQDFEILGVVTRQASITIQNTILLLELQQRAGDVERLHQELLRAREEERKRLARELHDEIMQTLVGLNYGLSKLDTHHAVSEDNGQVSKLQLQLHQIMGDLRRICKELRPPALDSLGLVSALRSLLREIEAESNVPIELVVDGDKETKIPEELEICVFRVLQEALTNIQKHAHATRVSVRLIIDPAEVRLCVEDDGHGFTVPAKLSQFMDIGHFGLVGMRERLDLVGGKLNLASTSGHGTCLEAWVPLPARHSPNLVSRS